MLTQHPAALPPPPPPPRWCVAQIQLSLSLSQSVLRADNWQWDEAEGHFLYTPFIGIWLVGHVTAPNIFRSGLWLPSPSTHGLHVSQYWDLHPLENLSASENWGPNQTFGKTNFHAQKIRASRSEYSDLNDRSPKNIQATSTGKFWYPPLPGPKVSFSRKKALAFIQH